MQDLDHGNSAMDPVEIRCSCSGGVASGTQASPAVNTAQSNDQSMPAGDRRNHSEVFGPNEPTRQFITSDTPMMTRGKHGLEDDGFGNLVAWKRLKPTSISPGGGGGEREHDYNDAYRQPQRESRGQEPVDGLQNGELFSPNQAQAAVNILHPSSQSQSFPRPGPQTAQAEDEETAQNQHPHHLHTFNADRTPRQRSDSTPKRHIKPAVYSNHTADYQVDALEVEKILKEAVAARRKPDNKVRKLPESVSGGKPQHGQSFQLPEVDFDEYELIQ